MVEFRKRHNDGQAFPIEDKRTRKIRKLNKMLNQYVSSKHHWKNRPYWENQDYNIETGKSNVGFDSESFRRIYDNDKNRFGYHISKDDKNKAIVFSINSKDPLNLVVDYNNTFSQVKPYLINRLPNEEDSKRILEDIKFDIDRLKMTKGWNQ